LAVSAVAELSRRIGISSLDDYEKLHQAAEAARIRAKEAHERVIDHIEEHYCASQKRLSRASALL
jgi:hypothetical protein